ncbi:MAG TPA: hypothetical protein VM451_02535 [Candidatus Limnocylindria bacterium]|nr:hypothetical protein [Candidatus Limnocylindria bacterium]
MSLHTIVHEGFMGRRNARPATAAVLQPPPKALSVRLTGASMRVLETGLALSAIATAVLLGLAR